VIRTLTNAMSRRSLKRGGQHSTIRATQIFALTARRPKIGSELISGPRTGRGYSKSEKCRGSLAPIPGS
jgi:hypothetical protein